MLKRDEIADPNSCWNKAVENEVLFVLLDRDEAAPATIRFWISERLRLGLNHVNDPKLVEAVATASVMEMKHADNVPRRPD